MIKLNWLLNGFQLLFFLGKKIVFKPYVEKLIAGFKYQLENRDSQLRSRNEKEEPEHQVPRWRI